MSVPCVTRTVKDPDGFSPVSFENIEPAWLRQFPDDKYRTGLVPCVGTTRLFEAYTPNSTKNHRVWKDFEHFKAQSTFAHGSSSDGIMLSADLKAGNFRLSVGYTKDDRIFNFYQGYGQQGRYNTGLTPWYVPRSDGGFIPPPDNLELLKQRGLKAMLPAIKSELSSLVSLYEIKDIVSIRGTFKHLRWVFSALTTKMRKKFQNQALAKMTARATADGYLQWMFNLKPLLSDMCGIYRILANYERRLNDFVARSGRLQTAHFMCPLKELLLKVDSGWTSSYGYLGNYPQNTVFSGGVANSLPGFVYYSRIITTDSAVFRSCMQYNYTLSAFQREHAKLLGLLDMFGINFNPSYVWNVVPWSFVVDWIFGVSHWLDQFEVKNLEPKVNILQYCWSVKKQRRILVRGKVSVTRYYGSGSLYPPQYIDFPEVTETSYRRGIDLPGSSSFTMSGLSPTELSLGAALITTRRRRKPKVIHYSP